MLYLNSWNKPKVIAGITYFLKKLFPLVNRHDGFCSQVPGIHTLFLFIITIGINGNKGMTPADTLNFLQCFATLFAFEIVRSISAIELFKEDS